MSNTLKHLYLLSLFIFGLGFFSHWWMFAILILIKDTWIITQRENLLIGFIAPILAWELHLAYQWISGGQILFERVSEMIGMGHPIILITVTGLLGGLLGALSCWSGQQLKKSVS